jgi:hypothetical protein
MKFLQHTTVLTMEIELKMNLVINTTLIQIKL